MIRQISSLCLLLIFLIIPCLGLGVTEVVQTGIASPQSEAEKNNIEKLRARAIRNAMDLAVMQVTGTTVSSERGGSVRSQEKITSHGAQIEEQSKHESRFSAGATSRTEGHAKLLEILKEWQENDQYFIEAKIAVESQEEMEKQKNCGDYWLQAGKPSISISFVEEFNGENNKNLFDNTFRFFRDNLSRNGVMVSTVEDEACQYRINILQSVQSKELVSLGTITMHCRLSFQIIDQERNQSVAEYRAAKGPQAGFTLEQAKESCIKAIAPDVSLNLIQSLGKIMLERWNNGVEQLVIINGMPGEMVTGSSEILQNLFMVTSATPAKYNAGQYTRTIKFKGNATDLAQAIQSAFANEDWKVTVVGIDDGKIDLQWAASE